MKLELKHLAGYLPYGLKIQYKGYEGILFRLWQENDTLFINCINGIGTFINKEYPDEFKPILRPLSDLTKEIEVNGEKSIYLVEIMKIKDNGDWIGLQYKKTAEIPFYIIQKLLEWHFDIYGLIENGLAIDINTLDK